MKEPDYLDQGVRGNNSFITTSLLQKTLLGATLILLNTTIVQANDIPLLVKIDGPRVSTISESVTDTTSIGGLLFNDANDNGIRDGNEKDHSGIHVKIFDERGFEINVGPDGVLGNEDDSPGGVVTDVDGKYQFQNISQNFYRIVVSK